MAIVGIDEVGRGCWAGPLVAAAVVLPCDIAGLKDSKLLSEKQRLYLARVIRQHALGIGIGWVTPAEVDQLGLTASLRKAMSMALSGIMVPYEKVIIDGNLDYLQHKSEAIIKADMTVAAVSAASVIAKVARDNYMRMLSHKFPQYAFDQHVGYGTALHRELLEQYGVSMLHRLSYRPVRTVAGLHGAA